MTYDLPTFRITQDVSEVRLRLRTEIEEALKDNVDYAQDVIDELTDAITDQVLLTLRDLHDEEADE